MKIQYVSDLHLEFREDFKNLFTFSGDILLLCGDICVIAEKKFYNMFIDFIKYISPKYKYIVHVPGNHEYYTNGKNIITMIKVNTMLKKIEKLITNYKFLNCNTFTINNNNKKKITFIGATLWTHIPKQYGEEIEKGMNDYLYIYKKPDELINYKYINRLHNKHKKYIINEIENNKNDKIVLMTHHKPIFDNIHKNTISYAYEVPLQDCISINVSLAVFGHTHEHYDKTINGVRYVSNALGYPYQHTNFDKKLTIDI